MPLYYVQIGATPQVEVYAGITNVDNYLLNSGSKGAAKYNALAAASDARKRLIVDATRYVDRQRWQGTKNAFGGTLLQFPRDGLALDGAAPTNATQLALVEQAVCELVAVLAASGSVYSSADAGQNIKALGAGKARVEFFSPTRTKDGTATKLPTVVDELIGRWLSGGAGGAVLSLGGSSSSSSTSNFDDCGVKRSEPL